MEIHVNSCMLCGLNVKEISFFRNLLRVTSDSKIWPSGGKIGYCLSCFTVQKIYEKKLLSEINNIYKNYTLYFQGKGTEQKIFKNGIGHPRSEILIEYFFKKIGKINSKNPSAWLDFGCGNGNLLRSLSHKNLNLRLYGADIGKKNKSHIESIQGVCEYFSNGLNDINIKFNFISLSHVLEHISDPLSFLVTLRNHLTADGYFIVAVPNWHQNPFDLLIADHYLHYSLDKLSYIINLAGYEIISLSSEVIPKELILIARPKKLAANKKNFFSELQRNNDDVTLKKMINWFGSLIDWAQKESKTLRTGLLGTALAATWLDFTCNSTFSFFLDEDPDRYNTLYLGRPVYSPTKIPPCSKVLIPLPNNIAVDIFNRLNIQSDKIYLVPPNLI